MAMVGTNPWIKEYWGATPEEQSNCSLMFQELYQRAQVYAFSCYKTHHVIPPVTFTLTSTLCIMRVVMMRSNEFKTSRTILMLILRFALLLLSLRLNGRLQAIIFYADLSGGGQTLITPSRLAQILDDESRGVLRILEKHQTCSKDLKSWAHNYIRLFLRPENLPAEQMEATAITADTEITVNQPVDQLRLVSRAVPLAPHPAASAEAGGSAGLRLVFLDVDGVTHLKG